jgi:hypothetical protein
MTANPAEGEARSRDLKRLRELTRPHLSHGALIQQALPHMTPDDFDEIIAILGPLREAGGAR